MDRSARGMRAASRHELKVSFDTQMWPERQILKYEPDAAPVWRDQAAAGEPPRNGRQPDLTVVRHLETGNYRSRVVLPHPLGPRITTTSPAATSKDTPASA